MSFSHGQLVQLHDSCIMMDPLAESENNVGPNPADQYLHCFENEIYLESAGHGFNACQSFHNEQ